MFSGEYVLIDGITNPDGHKPQRVFVLTDAVVNVVYEDEDGNKLHEDVTLKGHLNKPYTSEEKAFGGYTLTKTPTNARGTFTSQDQTVTYVYTKVTDAKTNTVTIMHVDEAGKELAKEEVIIGIEGEPYTTSPITITGYTLKETPENAEGTLGEDLIVTYVYKEDDQAKDELEDPKTDESNGETEDKTEGKGEDSTDKKKSDEDEKVTATISEDDTNQLPRTATSTFNYLVMGIVLLLVGSAAFIYFNRRKKSNF